MRFFINFAPQARSVAADANRERKVRETQRTTQDNLLDTRKVLGA